ncbi:E3 ubiquitin-protein ligase Iruka [Drosophila subobscura]|uniref:E3 ubiquitin-protein ligase Iruka n=1 Tax=Drosophila subobscura TaxID=7241 RepID=UPI00155B1BED|nr:E3 ubiquitin-protein ligase Iruka [Drosophila subobscura]
MAEAVGMEDRSAEQKRFFCHMCNVEINIPSADFTCPLCANGFVEELPANAPELAAPTAGGATTSARAGSSGSASSGSNDTLSRGSSSSGSQSNVEALRNDIVSLLNMRNVPNLEITIEPNRRQANVLHVGGYTPLNAPSNTGMTAGGRVRPANLDRLDNVLFDFLQSLPLAGATAEFVTGPGGGVPGNSHMFFMGNPGDYAWGREGLDTIVTQMLNQMETSGPPPLSSNRINEIPNVQITSEEVEKKMQCSICWDDFKMDETVRKLPCSHLYHENCIVPWLNLHSTCPICRKSLANDANVDVDEEQLVMLDGFPAQRNGARPSSSTIGTGTGNSTAASTIDSPESPSPSERAPARNNVFTFDDDNMFLD